MRAGKLRHTISIQSRSITRDAGGGAVDTWATVTDGTRPAEVRPISSGERFSDQQLQEVVTHRISCRWLSGITTKHRILFGTRAFDIQSVINWSERDRELTMFCVERLAT
jgi:SPP1 family predicted phage head-tail adaptor